MLLFGGVVSFVLESDESGEAELVAVLASGSATDTCMVKITASQFVHPLNWLGVRRPRNPQMSVMAGRTTMTISVTAAI